MSTKKIKVQLPMSTTVLLYVSAISNFIATYIIIKSFLWQ